MTRPLLAVLFAAVAAAGPAAGQAIGAREFLTQLREAAYTNEDSAIEDFQVDVVDSSVNRLFPEVGQTKVQARFYWKPTRGLKIVLTNLPADAEGRAGDIRSYLEDQWLHRILVRSYAEEFKGFRLQVEKKGSKIVATGESGGAFTESNADRMTVVFDGRTRPLERTLELRGGGTLVETYKTGAAGDRFLISRIDQKYENVPAPDGSRGDFQMSIDFEYAKVGTYSFPSRISASGMGQRQSVTFERYKVNEGFDDSIYEN